MCADQVHAVRISIEFECESVWSIMANSALDEISDLFVFQLSELNSKAVKQKKEMEGRHVLVQKQKVSFKHRVQHVVLQCVATNPLATINGKTYR